MSCFFVKYSSTEGCSRLPRQWYEVASAQRGSLFACWKKRVPPPLTEQADGLYNLDVKHTAQSVEGVAFCENAGLCTLSDA